MSRKSIGSLVAKLILMDGDFKAKLEGASRKVESEGKKMAASFSKAGVLAGAALAGGMAAGALVFNHRITQATAKVAELKRQTDRLGLASASWASYSVAAEKAGTSLSSIEVAMQAMKRAGLDASMGDMSKLAVFDKLNIDIAKFNSLNPDEKFRMAVDALNAMPNSAQAASVAQELFGTSVRDTMAILSMAGKELDDSSKKAMLLGLTINDIDAQKVLDASVATSHLNKAFEGLFTQLSVHLAPIISEVSTMLLGQLDEWGGIKAISRTVFEGMVTGASVVLRVFDGFELVWHTMKAGFYGIATVASSVALVIGSVIEGAINLGISALNKLIKAVNQVRRTEIKEIGHVTAISETALHVVETNAGKTKAAWGDAMKVLDKPPATDRVIKWVDHATEKWTKAAEATTKAKDEAKRYGEVVTSQFDKAAQSIQKVTNLLLSLSTIADKGGRSVNVLYAKQAEKFQERAEKAEAQGKFAEADRLRGLARKFGGLVTRRQQTEEMRLESAEAKGGTVRPPMSDEQRATDLHRQARVAFEQRRFADAARLEEQAKKLDRVNEGRKPKVPPQAKGEGRPATGTGATGTGATVTNAEVAVSTKEEDKGKSVEQLIAEVKELVVTLKGLPSKLGVA